MSHVNVAENCYNQVLDDEIRSRLDKLNSLSDLINSLERQFDEANSVFRDTLKCSTDRLSSIAKTLGKKSIRQGRVYHAARVSVEQSQSECQRACVQFEQANKDHQFAKDAIKEAETKLREIANETTTNGIAIAIPSVADIESSIGGGLNRLKLTDDDSQAESSLNHLKKPCDKNNESSNTETATSSSSSSSSFSSSVTLETTPQESAAQDSQMINKHENGDTVSPISSSSNNNNSNNILKNAAKLSEELNQAIMWLIEAESKRGQSERQHLDRANKLINAQENLIKLEREYGPSIRRSQLYFDEAKRFNAKLNSVKSDICRISEDILAAKQAYARTLSELEQFSEDLHDSSETALN